MSTYLTMHTSNHLCTYVYVHPQLLYSTNVRIPTHQPFQLPTPTCTIYSHSLPQPKPPPLTLLTHSSPPHMHQTLPHSLAITNSDKACMLYPACISKEKTNTSKDYIHMYNLHTYDYTNMAECTYCTHMAVHAVVSTVKLEVSPIRSDSNG